jgi:hypothetical protein
MRNLTWMSAGLCLRLLASAGPSFADGVPPRATPASATTATKNGAGGAEGGIEVGVLHQSCRQTVETEQPGNDLVDTDVELEIRNGTSAPIAVHRDRFQLVAPDGTAVRTSGWFAGAPRSVDRGRTQTFQLRFMSRGGLSCYKEMVLASPSAVVNGAQAVTLDAVRLAPAHARSGYDTLLD